jgi:aryl-alcohol dehydrogenase-like predicted oxidoreductase
MWDGLTPVEEEIRALDDTVRSGKVLYVGISDTLAWVSPQAQTLAMLCGWSLVVAAQFPYTLAERTPERDLLPMARASEMSAVVWAALGQGGVRPGRR